MWILPPASKMAALFRQAWAPLLLTPGRVSVGSRRGVRGLRRKPLRVLPSVAQAQEQQRIVPSKVKASSLPKAPAKERKPEPEPKEAELRYERAEPNEKRLSKLVTLAKSRTFREKHGKILLEGRRLITDALEAGAVPQMIFFSMMENLKLLPAAKLKGATLVKVKFSDIKIWSDVITPQGLIGIFAMPHHSKMTYPEVPPEHALPLTLICDNIRDPGNLGTILRSAAGAGCCSVLLVKGCVDAWEPKVLRAGMGAHFRIPIISNVEWELVPNYLPTKSCIHVAESSPERPQTEAERASPGQAACRGWTPRPPNRKAQPAPSKGSQEEEEEEEETDLLQVQPYYEPWMDAPGAIVVGGETHGVSAEARNLAHRSRGKQLAIPVIPGVESLNSAMAASVLLFEAKRQLLVKEGSAAGLQLKL
ncbi:rRNA methyltransferase 3, mitochondrial [Python bivittatus]|uniref:rRNA methyltransferase 3, mitochondrial n=1 Tax=Python bivittatus TaxID=176946 RepID=A0A9F2WJS1_PYTBI|nr:rRNA methyltransferase 3, mitochondrial [Python bivittatus]XP_025030099.1 rRNA methyltransferase 3, mitochondrial [Python bivittatus]